MEASLARGCTKKETICYYKKKIVIFSSSLSGKQLKILRNLVREVVQHPVLFTRTRVTGRRVYSSRFVK